MVVKFTATKTRMEIREQDFSFNGKVRLPTEYDNQERPVIEVVTKDVRAADIFNIIEVIGGEEASDADEVASWWKDAVTEDFSRQDIVLLALIGICALRVLVFVVRVTWKVMRLPVQWYNASGTKGHDEFELESTDAGCGSSRKQLAIIRFCHLQFLLVVEKLKREMREGTSEDTQQMVASLVVPQHVVEKEVRLAEILATLQKIRAKDCSFEASEMEEHLAGIKQDVGDEETVGSSLSEAWGRLQEIYASFLRIQATIIRRQTCRKTRQLQQHERYQQEEPGRRQCRLSSSEDHTNEVLHELQELTKELPQGFTADMFTSLGNAMHEKAALSLAKPETSFVPQLGETKPRRPSNIACTSAVRAKHSSTAQKAA